MMILGTFVDVTDVMNYAMFHLRVMSSLRAGGGSKMHMALTTLPCASALASDRWHDQCTVGVSYRSGRQRRISEDASIMFGDELQELLPVPVTSYFRAAGTLSTISYLFLSSFHQCCVVRI
jgi:hypothetical protein